MPNGTGPSRYGSQRAKVTPPHIALGDLRAAVGLTIDQLIARIEKVSDQHPTRGAISAIENGHRGASADLLDAIADAYGIRPSALSTTYRPRGTAEKAA
jgi:transcriptional regulator with XRE-family HTH domain